MLPIAGQTARPIGLNIFGDTHGWPGDVLGQKTREKKFSTFFSSFFFTRATPGPSASLV